MASSSSAVKVVIRTRPTASFAADNITVGDDNSQLSVRMLKSDNHNAQDAWSWKFDAVLHNSSQETVYNEQVSPIVASVLRGYNGTIMCYGQTGAGKTFTQLGSIESFQNRGITPRAVAEVFHYIAEQPQIDATVAVSYVEIHNDALYDLLSTLPTATPVTEPLVLTEDKKGETSVKNLLRPVVSTEEEALHMLFEGSNNRQVANHQLNRNSTRGHAIFTLHIRMKSRVDSSGVVTKCKLHLVDLAGSERLKKTDTIGDLRSESMYINKSLTYLEQVVVALASKGRSHTPYRQSKLTHLLKDSLGGNCKTLLIANVYGEQQHLEETISTLQFAARVRLVPNDATVNQDYDAEQLLKRYAMEINDLKRELAMHDSLSSRSRVAYEPYSDAQRDELMSKLVGFLDASGDDAPEMHLESVRQMRELLAAMKTIYGKQQSELDRTKQALATGGYQGGAEASDAPGGPGGDDGGAEGDGVGVDDPSGKRGIAVGKAPDQAKPVGGLIEPPSTSLGGLGDDGAMPEGATVSMVGTAELGGTMGKQEAYVQYKLSEGSEMNARLIKAKKETKEWRLKRAALAGEVNQAKQRIDAVKARLERKKLERAQAAAGQPSDEAEIIDEEEYAFIQELRAGKQDYKAAHESMTQATRSAESAALDADNARTELLNTFNQWYAASFTGGDVSAFNLSAQAPMSASLRQPSTAEIEPPEPMDDDEAFEQLQMQRIFDDQPDSLAFVRARKSAKGGAKPRKR